MISQTGSLGFPMVGRVVINVFWTRDEDKWFRRHSCTPLWVVDSA